MQQQLNVVLPEFQRTIVFQKMRIFWKWTVINLLHLITNTLNLSNSQLNLDIKYQDFTIKLFNL